MRIIEATGIAVLILLAGLILVFARRELIARRGGTIGMSMRLHTFAPGRGWSAGLGRFVGDELRWYRLFSFSLWPRRVLIRRDLRVENRRAPNGVERYALPEGWVVLTCTGRTSGSVAELALAESAVTGFLSWIEAAPPRALHQH